MMAPGFAFMDIFIVLVLYSALKFEHPDKNKALQENHPPIVKIITPKSNSLFERDAQVNYTISISDKEDGESKYDEINTKEVLLEVRYVKDESKIPAELNKHVQNDPPGLAAIRTSNCFNCHNFDSKAIGPSFYEITKRYPATAANATLLAKRIKEGSTGVWGNVSMPTHPELSTEDAQNIVQWIFQNAARPDVNYYFGTEGSFRMKSPVASSPKGAYVLTASYADHGVEGVAGKYLKGEDVAVIRSK